MILLYLTAYGIRTRAC